MRPIRFHDLRHIYASVLLMLGANLVSVQRLLGHSDPKITERRYGHLLPDFMRAEVNRLRFGLDRLLQSGGASQALAAARSRELHLDYIPARARRTRPGPPGFLRAIPASWMTGCTGLEPVASGVTVGPELLAGGSQVLQVFGNVRGEDLRTRPTSRTSGELRSALGTPVVRTPGAGEAGSIRFLTVRYVAQALRVSRATVYKAIASGSVPHVRVSNAIRIPVLAS